MPKFTIFSLALLATGIPLALGEKLRCYVGSTTSSELYLHTPQVDACIITFDLHTLQGTATFHPVFGHQVVTPTHREYKRNNNYNCGVFPYQYFHNEPHGMMISCACYTHACNKPVDYPTFIYSGRNITFKKTDDGDITPSFP